MTIINGVDMPNFKASEFPEDPNIHADPILLTNIQKFRTLLREPFYPSPAPGALARLDNKSTKSQHYAIERQSTALDIFPMSNIFKAWIIAQNSGLFNGVGVYFDTKFEDVSWPMLHLDIRESDPVIWFRANKKYYYPWDKHFYKYLIGWFSTWEVPDGN